jgi:hypothetical protein
MSDRSILPKKMLSLKAQRNYMRIKQVFKNLHI